LSVAQDLQRKLDLNKENPAKAARAMINDDRMPYLYSNGKYVLSAAQRSAAQLSSPRLSSSLSSSLSS
jgi:hypothetical protein